MYYRSLKIQRRNRFTGEKTVTVLNAFTIRGIIQYRRPGRGGSGRPLRSCGTQRLERGGAGLL